MQFWYTEENESDTIRYSFRIEKVLFQGTSDFQTVAVIDTKDFGRMLILDGFVMLTEYDEFVYHEMISHIPACLHRNPKKVVVIGGGDGGTVRELLKHKSIEQVVLCEIDQMVVDVSKEFFPQVACGFKDSRVDLRVGDGVAYMKSLSDEVDIAIIDSTDPIGPGEGLFTGEFYASVAKALRPGGLMAAQSESPWYEKEFLQRIHRNIAQGFAYRKPYIGSIPTYPRGLWSWTVASNEPFDPALFDRTRFQSVKKGLRYLSEERIVGAFDLPPFYAEKFD